MLGRRGRPATRHLQTGKVFNLKFTEEKAQKLMQKLDTDGDGNVDLGEWLGFFRQRLPSLPVDKVAKGISELLAKTK